jgi:predicted DNA-binding protein with PD1-like motif
MKAEQIASGDDSTHVLVFEKGDEAASLLRSYVRDERVSSGSISGIGAFERARLGFFDWTTKSYAEIPVEQQTEVLSLTGDVASKDGEPEVHVHVVLGMADGTTIGGHLMEGTVRPTLEVVLVRSPGHIIRTIDAESGLPLIDLARSRGVSTTGRRT